MDGLSRMTLVVTLQGARDFEARFAVLPELAARAASIAINDAAAEAVRLARKQIYREVAFPAGYLEGGDRMTVSQPSTVRTLEAVVSGRDRPTSLARFIPEGTQVGRGGAPISITVEPGQPKISISGNLRLMSFSGNRLLILKLKPGQRPKKAWKPRPIFGQGSGMWILYGPSVDQIFRAVSAGIAPAVQERAVEEFDRVFTALQR